MPDAEAVFGFTGDAGSVIDGHLDDFVAEVASGDGDEAVHAAKLEGEEECDFALHDAEGAAGVADGVAQEPETELAADDGADAADEIVFASVRAIALDQVGVFAVEEREHGGDFGGVVLKVGVEHGDCAAFGGAEAGVESGGLTVAFAGGRVGHRDDAEPGSGALEVDEALTGSVGRPVVDDDDFVTDSGVEEGGIDLFDQRRNVGFFVVRGGDDGEVYLSGGVNAIGAGRSEGRSGIGHGTSLGDHGLGRGGEVR